jgi:serine/threonine-protein kinase
LASARRAVELDPTLAEGHAVLGTCLTFTAWKWDEAERSFVRAIELNHNYSLARMWYSHLLAIEGRTHEALEQARRAVRLDPLSLNARASVALRLSEMGRLEPAIERLAADLAADPEYPLTHFHLGRLYCAVGRYEEAIVHLQRATAGFPLASGFLGLVLARAGRIEEARVVLGELERTAAKREIGAVPFTLVHWGMGSTDSALRRLNEAFDAREPILPLLVRDPAVASLWSIPGFAGLAGRLLLPGSAARSHEGPR